MHLPLLTITIFSPLIQRLIEKSVAFLLKKQIQIPQLKALAVFKVLPAFLIYWLTWAVAFYFLACSLSTSPVPMAIGLSFPLSVTLGIMAIIAPGGLGVREGVIVGCLTLGGLSLTDATTISVASRLWFLIGETILFLVAWLLDKKITKVIYQK